LIWPLYLLIRLMMFFELKKEAMKSATGKVAGRRLQFIHIKDAS